VLAAAVPAKTHAAREREQGLVHRVVGDREHDLVGAAAARQPAQLVLEHRPPCDVHQHLPR
jgi:hypothetical protein